MCASSQRTAQKLQKIYIYRENREKAVLKMQGRLEQSSVVPFERQQDQSRPALKIFRFSTVHRGKDENEMDENRDVG